MNKCLYLFERKTKTDKFLVFKSNLQLNKIFLKVRKFNNSRGNSLILQKT